MALSREREMKYSLGRKAAQEFYEVLATNIAATAIPDPVDYPANVAWYGASFVLLNEAIEKSLKIFTREELYWRQKGKGSLPKGMLKELFSTVVAGVVLGGSAAALLKMYTDYVVNWEVSDNHSLATFASIIKDPIAERYIVGNAELLLYKGVKAFISWGLDKWLGSDEEKIIQYPDLNILKELGSFAFNGVMAGATAEAISNVIKDSGHAGLSKHPHLYMLAASTSLLLNRAACTLYNCEPIKENIPKEERAVVIHDPTDNSELELIEDVALSKAIQYAAYSGFKLVGITFFFFMAFEAINALDNNDKLGNFEKAAIATGLMALFELIARNFVNLVQKCAPEPGDYEAPSSRFFPLERATNRNRNAPLLISAERVAPTEKTPLVQRPRHFSA